MEPLNILEVPNETKCLKVSYSTTTPEHHPNVYAYALKVEVLKAVGYPSHIFLFQRTPEDTAGDAVDEFIHIASPVDIEETPENAPKPDQGMPYYRSKEVTLWFRNHDDVETSKKRIKQDIKTLIKTYDRIRGLPDQQEVETYE